MGFKILSVVLITLVAMFFYSCNKKTEKIFLGEPWKKCLDDVEVIVDDNQKKAYIRNFQCTLSSYNPRTKEIGFHCSCDDGVLPYSGDETKICQGITSKFFDSMRGKSGQYILVISDNTPLRDKYGKVIKENTTKEIYIDANELNKYEDVNYWVNSFMIDHNCLIGYWFWSLENF